MSRKMKIRHEPVGDPKSLIKLSNKRISIYNKSLYDQTYFILNKK